MLFQVLNWFQTNLNYYNAPQILVFIVSDLFSTFAANLYRLQLHILYELQLHNWRMPKSLWKQVSDCTAGATGPTIDLANCVQVNTVWGKMGTILNSFPWNKWILGKQLHEHYSVADPGFPVGGGRGLPRWLRFENFVCQNERIWTLRGDAPGTPPSRSANATNLL